MNQQSEGMQTRRLKSSDRLNKDFPNKLNRTNT